MCNLVLKLCAPLSLKAMSSVSYPLLRSFFQFFVTYLDKMFEQHANNKHVNSTENSKSPCYVFQPIDGNI